MEYENNSWSKGRLQSYGFCPACGSKQHKDKLYCRRDDSGLFPDTWRMVACNECKSIYLDPRPDAQSLSLAYAEHYYTHSAPETENYLKKGGWAAKVINGYLLWRFGIARQPCWPMGAQLMRAIAPLRLKLDVYGRHIPFDWIGDSGKCLLDVGCGNGDFLLRVKEMNLSAIGVEPDPRACAVAKALGLEVFNGDAFLAELDNRRFDYITLNHVIEHVHNPVLLLKRVQELLRPGGWVWLALPNPEALSLRYFDSGWKGFHPPFHLLIPSQQVLTRWLEICGFKDIRSVRRGSASSGFWRASANIAAREGLDRAPWRDGFVRFVVSLLGTFFPRWADETIMMAKRAHD